MHGNMTANATDPPCSIKYVRAALSGEKVCRQFHDTPGFAIKGAMWANLAHMCEPCHCPA